MEYGVTLIFLFMGFSFGRLVLNQSARNYDKNLLILGCIFFMFGSKTVVFGSIDFKIMISNIVPPFLVGVLARRYMYNHLYKRDRINS